MPKYNPNHPDSIRTAFDNDGESLARAGFELPTDLKVFADDVRPRRQASSAILSLGDMPQAHMEAYARYQAVGDEELAYE